MHIFTISVLLVCSEVGKNFQLRVVLTHLDSENTEALLELNKLAFSYDFNLMLVSGNEEAARYLETLKSFENKSTASIQEKVETDFVPRLTKALTSVKSVNKTDVLTLLGAFGSKSSYNSDDW